MLRPSLINELVVGHSSTQTTHYHSPRAATRCLSWLKKLVFDPASRLLSFGFCGISRSSTQTTHYHRPRAAPRRPSLLKLIVDPASILLGFRGRRIFPSVFPLGLSSPPSPLPPDHLIREPHLDAGVQEPVNTDTIGLPELEDADVQEPVNTDTIGLPELEDAGVQEPVNTDTIGLPELEQLRKHRTFSRSEIDHFIGLLRSRAIDFPVEDDRHVFESNTSDQDSETTLEDMKKEAAEL